MGASDSRKETKTDTSTNQHDCSDFISPNATHVNNDHPLNDFESVESINIDTQEKPSKLLFWLDANVNNKENKTYKCHLRANYNHYNIISFESVDPCIKKILQISFEDLFIIISGRLYKEFIDKFNDNLPKIKVVPKIIIFTGDKKKFLKYNNDSKMKNILNDKFYNLGGIKADYINVYHFLSSDDWRIRPDIEDIRIDLDETEELTFEYIDSLEALILPRFFRTLIKINRDENFDKLNQYLYNKYINSSDIRLLLSQIEGIPSIPYELLCKYYARLYCYESDFYKDINHILRKESLTDSVHPIQKIILSYVKLLYEGLKLNCFQLKCNEKLYRFSHMSRTEMNKLDEYLKKKKEGLPAAICFSKAFLSFSEKMGIAYDFFRIQPSKKDDLLNIIFILNKNENYSNESLQTFINLSFLSPLQSEKEILFLPFSAFEIQNINEKVSNNITYYEIELDYLDKYTDKLKSLQNNNIIKKNIFGKEIVDIGIVEKTKIEKKTNNDIIENFEKFDEVFIENKQNVIEKKYSKQIEEKLNKDLIYLVKKEDIDNNGEVQILGEHLKGEDFVKLNKDKSYLIINGKKEELCYKYKLKEGINRIEIVMNESATNFRAMFKYCTSLIDISALKNWDVKNLTCLSCSFRGCTSLQDISPLKFWNINNVTDLNACLEGDSALTDLSPLENWDVCKVNLMQGTFAHCTSLSDISPLKNWKVGNVKTFQMLFEGCKNLKDISPLKNWNVESVTNFNKLFMNCSSLNDITPLTNWDVSQGISFESVFKNCFILKDIYPIQNWKVANGKMFNNIFEGCIELKDITALDNWNVSKKAACIDLFKDTGIDSSKVPSWCPKN